MVNAYLEIMQKKNEHFIRLSPFKFVLNVYIIILPW